MAIYANTEVQAVQNAGNLQLGDSMILPSGDMMTWDGTRWNPTGTKANHGDTTTSGLTWNSSGTFEQGQADTGYIASVTGGGGEVSPTNTTGGSPVTMADFIKNVESQTLQGRRNVFDRYADSEAFGRFLNPLARSVLSRQFDPMSSQYMLAAAPTAAGGAAGYNVSDAGTGLSFRDFLGGGARPTYAGGVYGGMAGTPAFGTQGTMGMTPWSRDQWQTRIGGLFGTPAEGTTMPGMPTGAAGDFLGALSMGEAANMIANAQTAGLNPILARSAPGGINRAIAAWQEANPTAGGAQLLRSYVGSPNTGGGTPTFNPFA
jgi:hypothetical protein